MRRLINELTKLPSVGEKSAVRLAYHLITGDERAAHHLAEAILSVKQAIKRCALCHGLTESETCSICSDSSRLKSLICVVEKPADVLAIERSGGFRGLYHVLHGLWSPLRGVDPGKTTLPSLMSRLERSHREATSVKVEELLLATSTTVEGDATALYIATNVSSLPVRVTRIAQGLPKGGELDYADEITLSHAIAGRRQL